MRLKNYVFFVFFFAIGVVLCRQYVYCGSSAMNELHRIKRSTNSFSKTRCRTPITAISILNASVTNLYTIWKHCCGPFPDEFTYMHYIFTGIPQPSLEFPLVLFSGDEYNNRSEGIIHRTRPGEYCVWARTIANSIQEFMFRSLLVFPGWKLTFQACCPSGNSWTASVSNVYNITSLHYFMFDNLKVGEGIFYTDWLHWEQEFSVKVDPCEDASCQVNLTTCSQTCYFGLCGIDGTCQCKDGYSGDNCEQRPINMEFYPSLDFPLLLFPQASFQGTPIKVSPDNYTVFARNAENVRTFIYRSARVLFTRTVTFSRNKEDDQVYSISPGSDISNLEMLFNSNRDFGTSLWFNYATTIDSEFFIKVAGDDNCVGCSEVGGSCYTGKCVCLPGYNGTFCENNV